MICIIGPPFSTFAPYIAGRRAGRVAHTLRFGFSDNAVTHFVFMDQRIRGSAESSHDSGGGVFGCTKKRGLKVCQTTCHTRGALVFGFKRCQAVWVSVTYQNRACSNNLCCFQRQFDLKFRATNGPKHSPPLSWDDSKGAKQ